MDRTTIMLPPELKTRAANQAKKMRISLGQYIREALKKSLEMENKREADDDPLFLDNAVFDGTTPEDLASNHNGYLYGDEK
jgi:predicted transcriptional regulator